MVPTMESDTRKEPVRPMFTVSPHIIPVLMLQSNFLLYFRIPSDLRGIVYCHAIRLGDDQDWKFLVGQYRNSTVPTEKQSMLYALGCSRSVWILARFLEWSLSEDSGIRKQDSSRVFSSVASNDIGFPLAKSFFEDRIDEIYE